MHDRERKKPMWRNTRRRSTTSAYSLTSPSARPGCSLSSHPTDIHYYMRRNRVCNEPSTGARFHRDHVLHNGGQLITQSNSSQTLRSCGLQGRFLRSWGGANGGLIERADFSRQERESHGNDNPLAVIDERDAKALCKGIILPLTDKAEVLFKRRPFSATYRPRHRTRRHSNPRPKRRSSHRNETCGR